MSCCANVYNVVVSAPKAGRKDVRTLRHRVYVCVYAKRVLCSTPYSIFIIGYIISFISEAHHHHPNEHQGFTNWTPPLLPKYSGISYFTGTGKERLVR